MQTKPLKDNKASVPLSSEMKTPEDPPIPSVMVNDKVPAKFVIGCSDEDFEDPLEEEEQSTPTTVPRVVLQLTEDTEENLDTNSLRYIDSPLHSISSICSDQLKFGAPLASFDSGFSVYSLFMAEARNEELDEDDFKEEEMNEEKGVNRGPGKNMEIILNPIDAVKAYYCEGDYNVRFVQNNHRLTGVRYSRRRDSQPSSTAENKVSKNGESYRCANFTIGESLEDLHLSPRSAISSVSLHGSNGDTTLYNVVPPDGGWGWVVVAASFMCNAIVDGIIFTSGMLFPNLKETYGASNAEVAWIASLLGGFYLIVGPFVSGLANAFGFRTVCILGSVIGAAACFISYFATSILYLYFSFGILGGMGFGLIYVPAVISTGFYFEKRRALATGIAVCGSGIGTFVMSPINTYLLTSFGERWNIIFLVYGGIVLLCAFFGLAFRPLSASTGKRQKPETPLLLRIKRARDLDLANCPSALSMASATSRSPSKLTLDDGTFFAHDLKPNAGNVLVARTLLERHGGPPLTLSKRSSYPGIALSGPEPILEEDDEIGSVHPANQSNGSVMNSETQSKELANGDCLLDDNKNETKTTTNAKLLEAMDPVVSKVKYPRIESAPLLSANSASVDLRNSRRPSRVSLRLDRPFYRDDIFYSGSMARLPQYQSSETVGQYHASVTHFPDNDQDDEANCKCCPTSLKNVLVRMFDLSLLSSITFIFLSVSGFLALMSLFVPFNFLPSYATDLGIDPSDASFIMSLIGICNTVGRIVAGWVSDHPKVDALLVNNLALIVGGAATIALPFLQNLSLLYLYATVFGLCVAAFASLRSILLVELLGLEKLTNAFGLLLLFQGFAATFGSPIAGAFVDYTKEYKLSFYVFGSIFALSGLLCIPLRRIKNWEEKRIDEKLRRAKYGPACT